MPSSLAWEDFPFSESLTEFLTEANKDSGGLFETGSPDKNSSIESMSGSQTDTQVRERRCPPLLDVTNTPAQDDGADGHGSHLTHEDHGGNECDRKDEKAVSPILENNEEEELKEDVYNCSADLFNSSQMDMTPHGPGIRAQTVRRSTGVLYRSSDGEPNTLHVTSGQQDLKRFNSRCSRKRDALDCIPPSQSTPIVKGALATPLYRRLRTGRWSSKPERNVLRNEFNPVSAEQLPQCEEHCAGINVSSRRRHTSISKRRLWKSDKHECHQLAHQHLPIQRGALTMEANGTHVCDLSVSDRSNCEDNDVIVPPTPAAQALKLRGNRSDKRSCNRSSGEGQQGGGFNCQRTLLDLTRASSPTHVAQGEYYVFNLSPDGRTAVCDEVRTAGDMTVAAANGSVHDENDVCDWSRDLFSDSV